MEYKIPKIRIMAVLFCLAALLVCWAPRAAAAESPKRQVAVVYDDSGSMVRNDDIYQANWCRAKYALEVFAAMLQQGDEMNVYPMSYYRNGVQNDAGPLRIDGTADPGSRVSAVRNMAIANRGTYFNAVIAANNDLQKAASDREKWLVILTDGDFDAETQQVQSYLDQAAADGVKVIYFVMATTGSEVKSITADPAAGVYAYRVNGSEDILSGVIEVANQVFSQQELSSGHIMTAGDSITVNLDVPIRELIVFAQGRGIQIGALNGAKQTVNAQAQTEVRYPDWVPDTSFDSASVVTDTSLEGVLAAYRPGDILPAGSYTIPVSDTSNVEIYYTPAVAAALTLTDGQGNTYEIGTEQAALNSGTYTVSVHLIDPLTGQPIQSDLVSLQDCRAEYINNGDKQALENLTAGGVQMTLRPGEVQGVATAELNHYQTVSSNFSGVVSPAVWGGTLQTELPRWPQDEAYNFGAEDLTQGSIRLTASQTDPDTGQESALSADASAAAQVTVTVTGFRRDSGKTGLLKKLYDLHAALFGRRKKDWMPDIPWTAALAEDGVSWTVSPAVDAVEDLTTYGALDLQISLTAAETDHNVMAVGTCTVTLAPPAVEKIARQLAIAGICFAAVLLVLILFLRKKRLPRGLEMTFVVKGIAAGDFAGSKKQPKRLVVKRKFTLFAPETAQIIVDQPGILHAPALKIVACTRELNNSRRKFYITNLEQFAEAVKTTKVNAGPLPQHANSHAYSAKAFLTCKPNQLVRGNAVCEMAFGINKGRKNSAWQRKSGRKQTRTAARRRR